MNTTIEAKMTSRENDWRKELDSPWFRWPMRIILAGFLLGAVSAAAMAWLNDPPFAHVLFMIGWSITGVGVVAGVVGVFAKKEK
ncbi:hypothetical protein BWI17_00605 [Betaproteobacteria bacterium GR16-43]|nr:hypothetical protein BWI17_00605 [Betaproteobacteria bacterium GR16-43]